MQPNIPKARPSFQTKVCPVCGGAYGPDQFIRVRSWYYPSGYSPICNNCITNHLRQSDFAWDEVDKACQTFDIPFVPAEFERLHEMNGDAVFPIYAEIFLASDYENLGWGEYFEEFKKLQEQGIIEAELPELKEKRLKELRDKWGGNYDETDLNWLENFLTGLLATQNVNGTLQLDQAIKVAKISLSIDEAIRAGDNFDKLLVAYDKMVKTAEFTPRNVKNINDFDTVGELVKWFEKKGWKNKFYDNVTRDVVDETLKNFQAYNQRLYTNESGIGDEITRRIEALKTASELENNYDIIQNYDIDQFETDGYDGLMNDEFDPGVE